MRLTTRAPRAVAAIAIAVALCGATASVVEADIVSNDVDTTVDATVETLTLQVGVNRSVGFFVRAANGDGISGCNLKNTNSLIVSVVSSSAAATVTPSSLTFEQCDVTRHVTVTGVAPGTATISVSDPVGPGSYNLAPARFDVTVTAPTTTTTTVSCPAGITYTGSALTPCTAMVSGAGGFTQALAVTYANNVNAGTATASASFAGNAAHAASSASATFAIHPATSLMTLHCPTSLVFSGDPLTPCTATVTGAGGLSTAATPVYTSNVHAGTASASANYAGDANHLPSGATASFQIARAGSQVAVTCPAAEVFDGAARTPCTARAYGVGGLDAALDVTYTDNVHAGTATASATFAGDADHEGSAGSATFTIAKAGATVSFECSEPNVYTGAAIEPCGARVTGVGGLDLALPITYADNVDAGTATASAAFDGDADHEPASATTTFEIDKAASTVTVTCDGDVVYTGAPRTPCVARASGVGGLDVDLVVTYTNNVAAGTATASAVFDGDSNHSGSAFEVNFEIAKAASSVTVSCEDVVYTGLAQTPCSASVTGAGVLTGTAGLAYVDNVNAGTASVTATYAGDANHLGAEGTASFEIAKAASSVALSCEDVVYTGVAQTPCSASVTGAGGLNEVLAVSYGDNVNAGSASASASYAGDDNHTGDAATATFEIAKAPSRVSVRCVDVVYTGVAQTPCSASVTGAGGLNVVLAVSYGDNVNAGSASASASYAGDDNHTGDAATATFEIAKAPTRVSVTCTPSAIVFTGSPIMPCSAAVTGAGGLDLALPVSYGNNVNPGTATATATYAGDSNHVGSSGSASFEILAWSLRGFHQPVEMSTATTRIWNTVKNGSTVPLKFELFAGTTELSTTSAVKSFTQVAVACSTASSVEDPIDVTTTGGTSLRYDSTGGQYIQNWQTPRLVGACYRVTMTALDGSTITAWFKLK